MYQELELQKYLRKGNTPESLKEAFGINIRRHKDYSNLVLFKYSQIESPMGERIVQESRGIILDENNNWEVVSFPYLKFFNHGEGHAAQLDMSTAEAQEKLDGSLMTPYYYDNKWHVSTSGMPDASGEVSLLLGKKTFGELFWETWRELNYALPKSTKHCYMFEMMTKYNRIVCIYDKPRIVLHGVRNLETMLEESPKEHADINGWELVRSFKMSSLEDIIELAKTVDPIQEEGYVTVDANFNRVKVKAPQYVALSHLKESASPKAMLDLIRNNEGAELLAYFPEFTELHAKIKTAFDELVKQAKASYDKIKDIEVQKDFALEATKTPYSGVLFALRAGKTGSVEEFFRDSNIKFLIQILGGKELFIDD